MPAKHSLRRVEKQVDRFLYISFTVAAAYKSSPIVDMTAAINTPLVSLNMLINLSPILPLIPNTSLKASIERMTEQTIS